MTSDNATPNVDVEMLAQLAVQLESLDRSDDAWIASVIALAVAGSESAGS